MENAKALTPIGKSLTPDMWNLLKQVGPVLHQSRLFGVTSPEAAITIALRGYELGLGLTTAFDFITVVLGKPSLSPRGALAIAMNSGELDGMKITEQKSMDGKPFSCQVWMHRKNGMEYATEFTMEDAYRAGLVKPGGAWETYPANLLKWRAIGFCLDVIAPDICGGLKRADEFGAEVNDAGEVIQAEWKEVTPSEPAPAAPAISLDDLVNQYGAESVIVAAEGRIPGTDEEVAAVAAKLGATNAS